MRYSGLLRTALKIKDAHLFEVEANKLKDAAGNRVLVKAGEGDPTGITGLYQHPNPRPSLLRLYDATLEELKVFPSTSVYRQSIENLTKSRKSIVENSTTNEQIEQKIGAGLIEEILVQAGEELELIKQLGSEKPWEELIEKPEPNQWKYFDKE